MQGSLVASGKWVRMISGTSKDKRQCHKDRVTIEFVKRRGPKLVGYVGGRLDYTLNYPCIDY